MSNERCCSQNNQGLHFAVCSYLMYSKHCGSCCNKTIWASHWRTLVANIFHRPKDSLWDWRNNHFSCATHLEWEAVSWGGGGGFSRLDWALKLCKDTVEKVTKAMVNILSLGTVLSFTQKLSNLIMYCYPSMLCYIIHLCNIT